MPGTLPKINAPFGVEQRDKIQAADVPRQAQLQRPAQVSLAVAFALGRLVDENRADRWMSALDTCQ